MKKIVNFIHDEYDTLCYIDSGDIFVSATAHCEPEDQEFHTNLSGENLAYYKALEKFWRAKVVNIKAEIKKLEDLSNYLFPPKFLSTEKTPKDTVYGVEMVKLRLDKKISKLKEDLQMAESCQVAMAMQVTSWVMGKDYLFKKLKNKKTSD